MPGKKKKTVEPSVSYDQVKQVTTCLDGFSLDLRGKGLVRVLRGLMEFNNFASRMFHKDVKSLDEYRARLKKNLSFFFRVLDFFQGFYGIRGFWDMIMQQSGTLFEKGGDPKHLLESLISARKDHVKIHLGTRPGSSFGQYIQRLVRHWDSVITKAKGVPRPEYQKDKLVKRCAEWRSLLHDGRLADAPELDKSLGRPGTDAQASRPLPLGRHESHNTTRNEPLVRATPVSVKAEPSDKDSDIEFLVSIPKVKKRKRESSDPGSSPAAEKDTTPSKKTPSKKRSRGVSPEPKKRLKTSRVEATTPSPEKAPRSAKRIAGLDRRLSDSLQLQLQHGSEITSLNSRFQTLSTQLSDIAAVPTSPSDMGTSMKSLEKTVSSNTAKLSALGEKVNTLGIEERVVEIDREQLRTVAAEALQTDLHSQLGSQLKEFVHDAISRIDIGGLVKEAVSQAMKDDDIHHRLQRMEQQFETYCQHRSSTPAPMPPMPQQAQNHQQAQMPEQPEPNIPAQDFAYKAREDLIIRQHQSIRTMAEKIQKLEAELDKSKNPGPLTTPSHPSQHHSGGGSRTSGPLSSPSLASHRQSGGGSRTSGPLASPSLASDRQSGGGSRTSGPLASPFLASHRQSGGGSRTSRPLDTPSRASQHRSGGGRRTSGPLDTPSRAPQHQFGGERRTSGPLGTPSHASQYQSGGGVPRLIKFED